MLRRITLSIITFFLLFSIFATVHAQTPTISPAVGGKLTNGCGLPGNVCCDHGLNNASVSNAASASLFGPFNPLSALVPASWGQWIVDKVVGTSENLIFGKPDYNQCLTTAPITTGGVCTCAGIAEVNSYNKVSAICNKFFKSTDPADAQALSDCNTCAQDNKFYTGIGCVPLTMSSFLGYLFVGPLVGFAGITALLVIIYSAFTLQISRGNPDKIKAARERLTAAIVGLLVIISAIFLLEFIGVDLLSLPGFGK